MLLDATRPVFSVDSDRLSPRVDLRWAAAPPPNSRNRVFHTAGGYVLGIGQTA
jgi:hypothetical protein